MVLGLIHTLLGALEANVELLPVKRVHYEFHLVDNLAFFVQHTLQYTVSRQVREGGKVTDKPTIVIDQSHLVVTHQPIPVYQHMSQ